MNDIRCDHSVHGASVKIRCQLLAGHLGKHVAVGAKSNAGREFWRWRDNFELRRNPYETSLAAGLPWAPDMPFPEYAAA